MEYREVARSLTLLIVTAVPLLAQANDKRILGIIPNFRTATLPSPYVRLSPEEKFKLARQDSFDRGTIALGLISGGIGQLTNSNPSFGQGAAGFARYASTAYGDFVIGNYFTEAIYPVMLHQDPRYFRRGTGGGWSRLGHAAGQLLWTHSDSGRMEFNFSEVAGNATAVAISQTYRPDQRTAGSAVSQYSTQLALDLASNILKEFWPDLRRKLHGREDGANH